MMNEPRIFTPKQIKDCDCFVNIDGFWHPARSMTMRRLILWHRIKLAWGVFIGRYDVLKWEDF